MTPSPDELGVWLSAVVAVTVHAVKSCQCQGSNSSTCWSTHRGTGHCDPASRRAPCRHAQNLRPFFTLVSEGKPLRRLLVISKGSFVVVDALHGTSPVSAFCGAVHSSPCRSDAGVLHPVAQHRSGGIALRTGRIDCKKASRSHPAVSRRPGATTEDLALKNRRILST